MPQSAPPPGARAGVAPARYVAAALWLSCAGRIALAVVPSMAVWGLNVHRFVPLAWEWTLLALPLVALIPAIARPLSDWLDRRRFDRIQWSLTFTVLAVALVATFPDRVWFTGDFIGRRFSLTAAGAGLAWYTHAMPLDILVHQQLGRLLLTAGGVDVDSFGRLLGAAEAAALALFTGYNKALSEVAVAIALFGLLGIRVMRNRRGLLGLALTLALALLLHRSALALLPAFGVAWTHAWRHGTATRARRWPVWLALAIPVAVLSLLAPHLIALVRQYDIGLFSAPGNTLARAAGPDTRLLDLFNVLLCLSPVALIMLPLPFLDGRRFAQRAEPEFLAALAIPLGIVAVTFHPPEGLFRFWDIVAPFGMALAILGAWWIPQAIEDSPGSRPLAVALACAAACTALSWLVHDSDTNHGLARVRAFVTEPPSRAPAPRASAYEFLGFRLVDLGRPAEAATAFASAAEVVPSPRVLRQWAIAEDMAGDPVAAASVLERIVMRDPSNGSAWRELAVHAEALGDTATLKRALRRLTLLDREP